VRPDSADRVHAVPRAPITPDARRDEVARPITKIDRHRDGTPTAIFVTARSYGAKCSIVLGHVDLEGGTALRRAVVVDLRVVCGSSRQGGLPALHPGSGEVAAYRQAEQTVGDADARNRGLLGSHRPGDRSNVSDAQPTTLLVPPTVARRATFR
jgi:hypothetical protein